VLYPLALYAVISTGMRRAICLVALALLLMFVGMSITKYAVLWLLGACVLHLNLPFRIPRSYLYVTLGVLVAASNSTFMRISGVGFGYDMVIGLVVSFLIREYQLAPLIGVLWSKTLSKKLANFSYSLYLYHFPLLIVIGYFINKSGNGIDGIDINPYLLWLLIVIFLYLYSYGLSLITEAKYHSVRSFLYAQLMGARPVQR
jgi:peptidoglycan/LPS O-acetylase OafA/YrhL